jgi:hypothetical protein
MMLRLNQTQRVAFSDTLRELANLVAGALALGQFVGEQRPSLWLVLAGMTGWIVLVGWGLLLRGDYADG